MRTRVNGESENRKTDPPGLKDKELPWEGEGPPPWAGRGERPESEGERPPCEGENCPYALEILGISISDADMSYFGG